MGSLTIFLLLASVVASATAKNPKTEHIIVFAGEPALIDCLEQSGTPYEPILMYRAKAKDELATYFYGTNSRPGSPPEMNATKVAANDYLYKYEEVKAEHAGEYECDWSHALDEVNHHLIVMKEETFKCPEFKNPVTKDVPVEGLTCSIEKSGFIREGWVNKTQEELHFVFEILDKDGKALPVQYEDTDTMLSATVKNAVFTREHNGTTLKCHIKSQTKKNKECETNAVFINWPPTGVTVEAPDFVEKGKESTFECKVEDLGNPEQTLELKMDGEKKENTKETMTIADDAKDEIIVECSAGDVVDSKNVTVAYGPEKVTADPVKIEADEGQKLNFTCEVDAMNPKSDVQVSIDEKELTGDIMAKGEYHGKKLKCKAVNEKTNKEAEAEIELVVQHGPLVKGREAENLGGKVDEKLVIDCTTSAFPEPTYKWSFAPSDPEAEGVDASKYDATTDPVITLDKFATTDEGKYTCTVKNDLGEKNRVFTVAEGGAAIASISLSVLLASLLVHFLRVD